MMSQRREQNQNQSSNNHPHCRQKTAQFTTRSSSAVWRKSTTQSATRASKKSKNEPSGTSAGAARVVGFATHFATLCQERGVPYVPDVVLLQPPSFNAQMSTSTDFRGKELETSNGKVRPSLSAISSLVRICLSPQATKSGAQGSGRLSKSPSFSRTPKVSPPGSRTSLAGSTRTIGAGSSGSGLLGGGGSTALERITEGMGAQGSTAPVVVGAGAGTDRNNELNYFRPQIQIEQDDPDDPVSLRAVHIRGWKVDTLLMEVLTHCWRYFPSLRFLRLTNCGMQGQPLQLLASTLPLLPALHSVSLDNNPLQSSTPPVSVLLGRSSRPWHLSLRFCHLGDDQVKDLAQRLGTDVSSASVTPHRHRPSITPHHHPSIQHADEGLVTLNLSNNDISDVGAGHLADALKSNRSLAVLNLAGNKVGDAGADALAQALSWFPLSPHQESVRRALIHADMETSGSDVPSRIVISGPSSRECELRLLDAAAQPSSSECGLQLLSPLHKNLPSSLSDSSPSVSSSSLIDGGHFLCHDGEGGGGGGGGAAEAATANGAATDAKGKRSKCNSSIRSMPRKLEVVFKTKIAVVKKTDKEGQEKEKTFELKKRSSKMKTDKEGQEKEKTFELKRRSSKMKTDKEGQEKREELKKKTSKTEKEEEEMEKKEVQVETKKMSRTKTRKGKENNDKKKTSVPRVSLEHYRPRYKPSWCTDPCVVGVPSHGDHPHPLLSAGVVLQGKFWLPGNRSLLSLNLSRNQVGPRGVQALLQAVQEQQLPSEDWDRVGLCRLVLQGNPAVGDQGCGPVMQELVGKLKLKDLSVRRTTLHLNKTWVTPCALPLDTLG